MKTSIATPGGPGNPLGVDGNTITALAGAVTVTVQCVRPGASYRLSIRYASTGFEVDELSRGYADEVTARTAARTATVLFRAGLTVIEAIALVSGQEVAR